MTDLQSLRGGIARRDYDVDCATVAEALADRLLTGRALLLPSDPPGIDERLELGVTGTGSIYFHRRSIRRRRVRTLQAA